MYLDILSFLKFFALLLTILTKTSKFQDARLNLYIYKTHQRRSYQSNKC